MGEFFEEWCRFSDLDKVCPLCDHDDSCCISRDGSKILCSRTESDLLIGEPHAGGYIHATNGEYKNLKMPKKKKFKAPINWNTLNKLYEQKITRTQICDLAKEFVIYSGFLIHLGMGWDGEAYTFPVKSPDGEIIGIQRRFKDGSKCMVKGSSLGLFVSCLEPQDTLYITEGVSDLACLLDLGFYGIAKPSAKVGNQMVIEYVGKTLPKQITIICDNDKPGIQGVIELARMITFNFNVKLTVMSPPLSIKDLRKWIKEKSKKEVKDYLK